jgi:hypothetical protein
MDELTLKNEAVALVGYGNNFLTINDQDDFVLANEYLQQNKAEQKKREAYFDEEIDLANKLHKSWLKKKKDALEMLIENFKKVSSACGEHLTKMDNIKKAEQARLDEEARKKAAAAQAAIIAAAEKEEKTGDAQCAADLMEQAADIVPEKVTAPEVVSKVKTQSGSSAWTDDLSIELTDEDAFCTAVRSPHNIFPRDCMEVVAKISMLKKWFNFNKITEYNANGLKVKTIKVPKLRV